MFASSKPATPPSRPPPSDSRSAPPRRAPRRPRRTPAGRARRPRPGPDRGASHRGRRWRAARRRRPRPPRRRAATGPASATARAAPAGPRPAPLRAPPRRRPGHRPAAARASRAADTDRSSPTAASRVPAWSLDAICRARPALPPAAAAVERAALSSISGRRPRMTATASTPSCPSRRRGQRERTVSSSMSGRAVTSTNCDRGGGSSSVFNSAFWAAGTSRSASSTIINYPPAPLERTVAHLLDRHVAMVSRDDARKATRTDGSPPARSPPARAC